MHASLPFFCPIDDLEALALAYAPMATGRPLRFYAHLSPTLQARYSGDGMRIAQIVDALLGNAFCHTSSGKITLSAQIEYADSGKPVLRCRVFDSGDGIDAKARARIFDSAAPARTDGKGRVLANCARDCATMGGTLTLDSIAGMGSVFTATVPLIPFHPFDPPRDTRAAAMPRNTVAFILCHEPDMEQRLIETLQLRGWSPRAMASLDAAIHALRTMRPPAFVLVNDDYRRDAAQRLHAAGAVPVIRTASEGPRHPAACGEGCLEVTEYSHRALLEAIDIAMKHRATDFSRIDMSPGNSGVSRSLHNTSTPYA